MRKITVQVLLGAALIAAMCLGAPTAAFADETTTKEETAEKTGDKDSAEEKETAEQKERLQGCGRSGSSDHHNGQSDPENS